MSTKRFDGDNNIDISSLKRFDGDNWIDTSSVKRFDGADWIDVWTDSQVFKPTSEYDDADLMQSIILVDEKNIRFENYESWRQRQIRFNCYDIPLKEGDIVEANVGNFNNGTSSFRRYVQLECANVDPWKHAVNYEGMHMYKYTILNHSATHMVISVTINGENDYTIALSGLSIRLGTIYVNGKEYNPIFKL